jgi:hypothetical protein
MKCAIFLNFKILIFENFQILVLLGYFGAATDPLSILTELCQCSFSLYCFRNKL